MTTANCVLPGPQYLTSIGLPTKTVCYPQNHQPNVKVFDLQKNTFVAVFPTGGGCLDQGFHNAVGAGLFQILMAPCTAPLGLYAPPSAAAPYGYSVTGNLGRAGSIDVAIGVDSHDGQVYVMVTNPGDNTPRNIGCAAPGTPASAAPFAPPLSGPQVVGVSCQEKLTAPNVAILGPTTGANGGCSENAPAAGSTTSVKPTVINPWDDVIPSGGPAAGIQGQTGSPYMTLFTMDPTTGYLTYRATIKIDDHNSTNGAAIGTGSTGPTVPGSPGALPNARLMIVESGFRGCDNKGRHGPDLGQITWNPKAGAGGAFMMAIPNVLNNPPICYLASPSGNLCGPPTTSATAITVTTAAATATVPPGPGAFAVNFMGQSYIPGPWLQNGDPSQGGYPAGGCIYPTGAANNNLIGSVNNQANGGFEWDCDGALAMIDPVYVYRGPKQPNILTGYPMWNPTLATPGYGVYVGQPYDGACSAGPTCIADPYNTYPLNLANCPKFLPAGNPTPALPQAACPHHLVSPGVNYPPAGSLGNGMVFQTTAGSIGGVVYLPYCSPGSIELGPTDIPGGWDGKGAGDVSSLTKVSSGRTSTFANIFLGCNPYWNGNAGTGQGQLTVNIQENYSLALNTLSATSQPPLGRHGRGRALRRSGFPGSGVWGSDCGFASTKLGPLRLPRMRGSALVGLHLCDRAVSPPAERRLVCVQ